MNNPFEELRTQIDNLSAKVDKVLPMATKEPDLMGFKAACSYIGYSENYMRQLCSKRQIPHLKPAGKILFSRGDLKQWVEDNKIEVV